VGIGITAEVNVREAMSSPVISVQEEQDIINVARIMREGNVGAIIVINKEEQPVGIVTERDIVTRVVAQ
jgi:CBS domain-containing protein